ncbi:MAG: TadE/TadG family type IV pilus assembly protein [Acetobacteraceae bacterium]
MGRFLGILFRARRCIAALEFALVAPTLLLLMLLVMESGLLLFGQAALDAATADAARMIRTGQVQQASNGQSLFTTAVCGALSALVPCGSVQVNVQSGTSFAALSTAVAITATGAMQTTGFVPGGPGADVVVQVGYQPNLSIPLVGSLLQAAFGPLLVSTLAFQNEDY